MTAAEQAHDLDGGSAVVAQAAAGTGSARGAFRARGGAGNLARLRSGALPGPPWLYFVGSLVVGIAIWHFAVIAFDIPTFVLPPPATVAGSLYAGLIVPIVQGTALSRQGYVAPVLATLQATLGGFVFGAILGLVVGVVLAELPIFERLLLPYVAAFQSLPKVALAPLFVIWFGYGGGSRTILATTLVFFPVMVSTLNGFHLVGAGRIELARSYRASTWDIVRYIKLPSALPSIVTGLEVSIVYALLGAIAAELVAGNEGIGARLLIMLSQSDIPGMFAMLVLSGVIGSVLNGLIRAGKRKVLFWA